MADAKSALQAQDIIRQLQLQPHPEGGWYRELYRSGRKVQTPNGPRSALTTIYYLLEREQRSRWHVVDADEVWHFYGGAALDLFAYDPASRQLVHSRLTPLGEGGQPASVVPAGVWQAARTQGDYSLVGCSVGPGFDYAGFRLVASLPEAEDHFRDALGALRELL
jgi:predicted cupin superfamily sugar epimerase